MTKRRPNLKTTAITAILCITLLMGYALYRNVDGTILAGALVIIAGLGGYVAGKAKKP